MGVSRDIFYRYQELAENGGVDVLINKTRRSPNSNNRVDEATEQAVVKYATDQPAHQQHRTSNELHKQGVFVSSSGVRSIWLRHNLEKKKHDDEACGEIETAHPGYLGFQGTFYAGNMKGVGRIYQQTFVDTYSKVAFAKLYTTKTPINAADMLCSNTIGNIN